MQATDFNASVYNSNETTNNYFNIQAKDLTFMLFFINGNKILIYKMYRLKDQLLEIFTRYVSYYSYSHMSQFLNLKLQCVWCQHKKSLTVLITRNTAALLLLLASVK